MLEGLMGLKPFRGIKIPPYVVVMHRSISTTYGGRKSQIGFVAVFRTNNEVGIDARIPVGYKLEFTYQVNPAASFRT